MPTISLFFVLLSASFLLCGGLIAWIFADRRHRRASQQQELCMTQQVLQHSALCEDLELRITDAIAAFGRNEDSFRALLMERNGLIEQLESAIASYESASTVAGAVPEGATDGSPDPAQSSIPQESMSEDAVASEVLEGAFGIDDWEQQIEALQAEKHAELARQSETIAGLTERVEALAKEAQEAGERAAASAETLGQQGEVLQFQVDEWTTRYEQLEERSADETSKLRDDLGAARTEAERSAQLGVEVQELHEKNTKLRDAQLAADGAAEEQLQSLKASSTELNARAEQSDRDLALAQDRIGELEESAEAMLSELDEQQALTVELEANMLEHAAQAAEWLAANAALTSELERLAAQAEERQAEHEALAEELATRVGMLTAEKDRVAQTLGAREMAFVQLEQVSNATSVARDQQQARAGEFEQRVSELEQLAQGRQEQLGESRASAQALAQQIAALECQVETLSASASMRDAELEQGQEQIQQLEQAQRLNADALVEVGAREAAAVERVAELTESLTTASAERDAVSGKLSDERAALVRLRDEHEQVRGELRDTRGDLKEQALTCTDLETRLQESGQQHESVSSKLATCRDDLKHLQGAHALLSEDLSEVRENLEQEQQRRASLVQQLSSVQSELEGSQSELGKAKRALAARESSFETAQGLLADLGPIFETLQSQLEKKTVLTALQSELRKPEGDD